MKKKSLRLILAASIVYFTILFLARGFLAPNSTPPLYLLAGPLILVVLILLSDLSARATSPSQTVAGNPPRRSLAREVQLLVRQINVGAKASPEYFESVLLSRLREILVEKVGLETGMEREGVRELLTDNSLGVGLLGDEGLYRLLYSKLAGKGSARVNMLREAVERVEAWKP